MRFNYPFSALVGQAELQLGIILNIINPKLGGLLIKGVKGSGKSTAISALNHVVPDLEVMKNCRFNCDPQKSELWCEECNAKYNETNQETEFKKMKIITIPLSITEDRLLGSINIETLLKSGKQHFMPGILSQAHRQILYIDEVNLLPDHIVDDILDVSALGWNTIERDGFSISHRSQFIMIGTMNPEEGELRPQFLDRFPLSVQVDAMTDESLRKEVIVRNLAFEDNPADFIDQFRRETDHLKIQIDLARSILGKVRINSQFYDLVVKLCASQKVEGHRADISIIKTAQTHASLELKEEVELRHIRQAAKFVLKHRTRNGGFTKSLTEAEIDNYFDHLKSFSQDKNRIESQPKITKNISLFSQNDLIQSAKK